MTTIRSLQRQVEQLRQSCGAANGVDEEPSLVAFTAEIPLLHGWLASVGLSAREALARGMVPPVELGLHHVGLADLVEAEEAVREYRRQREAEGAPALEPQRSMRYGSWDLDT
jgi:hypothetical protein